MMSIQMRRRVAGVVAVAVGLVTMAVFQGYGTGDEGAPAAPSDARCDAPQARPAPGQTTILAQIRYDSGLVLRYCGLQSMFAQLGALEQPGLVRAVQVLTSQGGGLMRVICVMCAGRVVWRWLMRWTERPC